MDEERLRASWNRLSAHYQERYALSDTEAHYGVYAPTERQLNLLGDVEGKRILEIGCGGGQCSIAFALQGAQCTGVDLSDEQIAFARGLAEQHGVTIRFEQGEMCAFMEAHADAGFDVVFSAYAMQYVPDLERCIRAAHGVLRDGGLFVFSLDHPLSDITTVRNGVVMLDRGYFDRGEMRWNWDIELPDGPMPFVSYHRTFGDMLNLLLQSGFAVERVLEPEPVDEHDPWSPREYARFTQVPATIIWKARR